jgi:acyl-CoA thioester hydrolase
MTKHTTTFDVRHYECDAYGHLNNAVYPQYMQEAAINASSACGLDRESYDQMERIWLIRASEVEYLSAARSGDQIDVDTWVAGYRRTTSRREYELWRRSDGTLIAKGASDWVFLDTNTLRPVEITAKVREALGGNPGSNQTYDRIRLDDPLESPPGVYSIERGIEWRDIDEMQHLNNSAYLSYAEDCAIKLSEAYGWPFQRWVEAGVAFVARNNRIEYIQPAFLNERLVIRTWLYNVRHATATRYYEFLRASDGDVLAKLQTNWVLLNLATGRPTRFPPDFNELLADNIASR